MTVLLPLVARCEEGKAEANGTILNTKSFWRICTVRETPEVIDLSGKIVHGKVVHDFKSGTRVYSWFKGHPDKPTLTKERWEVKRTPKTSILRIPSSIPENWMQPDFNDSDWFRGRGPLMDSYFSRDEGWKTILMRGAFEVKDPKAAGDLKFSLSYRGGAVVYLNGEEVLRTHMPGGQVDAFTPAKPYPDRADYMPDGFVLPWTRQSTRRARSKAPQEVKDGVALRTRSISDDVIPASKLRKGMNILAVSVHRAPTPAARYVSRPKGMNSTSDDRWWTRLGLNMIELKGKPGDAVLPNLGPRPGQGFKSWNQSIVQRVGKSDYADPFALLNPIQIVGTRNGSFSGQIVVGDEKPIKGIKVAVSDLSGPGVIPKSSVIIRYGLPDGGGNTFDSLELVPPEEVPTGGKHDRSVQPVWLTVHVPEDAKPGTYEGTVTINAEGVDQRQSRLQLEVCEYLLPPSSEFPGHVDLIQSPESVAMAYDVPLWSDAHFALLDKSFALLGDMGVKTLYISAIRRTHFGNQHAMVRWIPDEEGEMQPDFTIVEKYLDAAIKHMGRIPGVILYSWEPPYSQGHAGGVGQEGKAGRIHDKPILFSVYDPDSGGYFEARGPTWGTQEAR
ncbi:MAG: glycoside hydrolase domain-containing protein, partial [Verrucomicrobiota bacterium]